MKSEPTSPAFGSTLSVILDKRRSSGIHHRTLSSPMMDPGAPLRYGQDDAVFRSEISMRQASLPVISSSTPTPSAKAAMRAGMAISAPGGRPVA